MRRRPIAALSVIAVLAAVAGAFYLGRRSAPVHDHGWAAGEAVGYDSGLSAGRALQIGDTVTPGDKDVAAKAFKAGYRAAQVDSFGSYDGGWNIGAPYVVILGKGLDGAPYRIAQRDLLVAGTVYTLCPGGSAVCRQP
jgi:hypothetical protein